MVVEAASADEALEVLRGGTEIDVVFTDVNMPGSLNGIGLVDVVRSSWPNIRIIVTSGRAPEWPNDVQADAFFGKPYNPESIILRIGELLPGIPK